MKNILYNLIALQEVDNELQALEDLKGNLPQQVKELQEEVTVLKSKFEKQKNDLEEMRRTKLHWERELTDLQNKLKKYQDQLYSVTTNRQYDAITIEIDDIKEKISEAETKIIDFMDKEETFENELENLSSQIEILDENLHKKELELTEKIKITEHEHQSYEKRRQDLISHIKKPILYQYERIRRVKGKTAVVEINKYACGGCFATIPPQKKVEIRHMDQLILCESCGRILVSKNENEVVTT